MAFDDFEDNTINRWTQLDSTGGSFAASGTAKKFGNYGGLMTTDGSNDNGEITFKNSESSGDTGNFYAWMKTSNVAGNQHIIILTSGVTTIAYFAIEGGAFRYYDGGYLTDWSATPANNTWYRLRIDIDNSGAGNIDYYLYDSDGNFIESKLNCTPNNTGNVGIVLISGRDKSASTEIIYWDNVTYTSTAEPTPPVTGQFMSMRKLW